MRSVLSLMVIAASFLALAGLPAQGAPASRLIDRLEASVNSSAILLSDVRRFRESAPLRAKLDPLFASSPVADHVDRATDSEIVNLLIQDRLILLSFPVTDAEVEQEINSIQSNQRISRERLREEIRRSGFRFDEYFELIRLSTAKRNLIDREIRSKVTITDDDVKNAFYNRVSKSGGAPMSYRVKVISFSRSNYKTAKALQETAERAMVALKSGDSFEDVARRFGDDTAEGGMDLGPLTEEQMSPSIRNEVKKLKVGGISPVFGDSASRLFLLKVVDASSGEDGRLASMREEIRNQLAAVEYQRQIELWLERQERQAFIHRVPAN
jgi:peptidyl-prolyl cis-trans isomerase SurA